MDAYETEYYEELIARHEEVVEAMVVVMSDKMDNEVDELMEKEK
jgi:hypothetical protein